MGGGGGGGVFLIVSFTDLGSQQQLLQLIAIKRKRKQPHCHADDFSKRKLYAQQTLREKTTSEVLMVLAMVVAW